MLQALRIPTLGETQALAAAAGFELAGIAPVGEIPDFGRFSGWVERGQAGAMGYLTDHRAALRSDVRHLLSSARSVICVGKLYNGPEPYSTAFSDYERGWIARYAWGEDYHHVLRRGLEGLARDLAGFAGPHEWKACVDTAPVLERSLARSAGLGWIGKNTCLINQAGGSWFFLGELLTSLPLEPSGERAPDRCGTCTRCIEACPTQAILPSDAGGYEIDSRRCISYLTIELRGGIDEPLREGMGRHIFGCDICQDVCPWNHHAASLAEATADVAPPLIKLAALSEQEFQKLFRETPVSRARYRGFLRNVAVAIGNSGSPALMEPLKKLTNFDDPMVREHALWALQKLESEARACTESYSSF
jgi:epoxyqueuosine reductase